MIVAGNNSRIIKSKHSSNIFVSKNICINSSFNPNVNSNVLVFNNTTPIILKKEYNGIEIIINNENLGQPTTLILDYSLNSNIEETLLYLVINTGQNSIILQNGSLSTTQLNLIGSVNLLNTIIDESNSIILPSTGPGGSSFFMNIEPGGIVGMDIAGLFVMNENFPIFIEETNVNLSTAYNNRLIVINTEESNPKDNINVFLDESFGNGTNSFDFAVVTENQLIILTNNTGKIMDVNLDINLPLFKKKIIDVLQPTYPSKTLSISFPLAITGTFNFSTINDVIYLTGNLTGENIISLETDNVILNDKRFGNVYNNYNITSNSTKIRFQDFLNNNTAITSVSITNTSTNKGIVLINETGYNATLVTQVGNTINSSISFPVNSSSPTYSGNNIKLKKSFFNNNLTITAFIV